MKQTHDIALYRSRLRNLITHFANIPSDQMDEFLNVFSLEIYPKKSLIIAPATVHNKLYFMISGLVRIYYYAEGKEITTDFKEENTFFTNGYTLFTKLPNIDYYMALEDTVCLAADYNGIERLSSRYHEIEHLGRKIVERYYATFLISNYNKLFLSADERYDVFIRERAAVMNRVPLRHIASHLGIKPETLSRIRAKQQSVRV